MHRKPCLIPILFYISTDKASDTRYGTTVALKKMRMAGEKNGMSCF